MRSIANPDPAPFQGTGSCCCVSGGYTPLHHRLMSAAPPAQRLVGKLMADALRIVLDNDDFASRYNTLMFDLKKILYPSSAGFRFFKGPDSFSISSRMDPGDRRPTVALGHS